MIAINYSNCFDEEEKCIDCNCVLLLWKQIQCCLKFDD